MCLLVLLSLAAAVGPGGAQQRVAASPSAWWPEVRELDDDLRKHKWRSARRQTRKLAERVLGKSWYGPELGRILAELALFEAIADANLGRDREAIWYWHVATNLDSAVRSRDLGPYGEAGKLLYEFPLRARGEIPVGFEDRGKSAVLKWLLDAPAFEPRRIAGEPTDSVFHLTVEFLYARW